ncbi:hypothetical protein GCM10027060_26410 [Nesterenkonia halophila]
MESDEISRKHAAEPATLLHEALCEAYLAQTGELDADTADLLQALALDAAARMKLYTQWMTAGTDGQRVAGPTSDRTAALEKAGILELELRRRILSRWHRDPDQPPAR